MPETIPLFPLGGVLLLPGGYLPLNIFEPRYIAMVEGALKTDRMIGMIQPSRQVGEDLSSLYDVGCAGKITSFNEAGDGRFLITLTGLSRFRVTSELPLRHGYRAACVDWSGYGDDLKPSQNFDLDRGRLRGLLSDYFELTDLSCEWSAMDGAPDDRLINCLSMICPLEPCEKQALLEAPCCRTRADMFMAMLDHAVRSGDAPDNAPSRH